MQSLDKTLLDKLELRKASNAFRTLEAPINGIDFSSNDYLGFSKNTFIYNNTLKLLADTKLKLNGSTGSRLISGNHILFEKTEKNISKFHQTEAALIFNSGYTANTGVLSCIPQRHDYILYDEYSHASIREGISQSLAKSLKFKHNNLEDLENKIIKLDKQKTIYVVTETVFSMDGDSPQIETLIGITKKYNVKLILDEAHALGVIGNNGKGLLTNPENAKNIFARIITFGKGLGCHGAAVLGTKNLKDYLINFSKPFIYTTALAPHAVATINEAYKYLQDCDEIHALQENISFFKNQIKELGLTNHFINSDSAIQCCKISGNKNVKKVAQKLNTNKFIVKAILSPTVPVNEERIRICLHSFNSKEDITNILKALKTYL